MRFYFCASKFHHKLRAKRKKDREKKVFTSDNASKAFRNAKIVEKSVKIVEKRELRSVQSVEVTLKAVR